MFLKVVTANVQPLRELATTLMKLPHKMYITTLYVKKEVATDLYSRATLLTDYAKLVQADPKVPILRKMKTLRHQLQIDPHPVPERKNV